jgi:predicted small secreted protein
MKIELRCGVLCASLAAAALAACSTGEGAGKNVCDQLGSFHRDARSGLERLRTSDLVSHPEWECMAEQLAGLDESLTERCAASPLTLAQLREEQRTRYGGCLDPPRDEVLQHAVVRRLPPR